MHSSIAFDAYLMYTFYMNTFEFKNLVKNLKNSLKQRTFFKDLRKEVNKDTIATTRQ